MIAAAPVELTLPFLGTRGYLHGTTLLTALRELVPADAALSLRIARMIPSDRIAVTGGQAAGERPHAVLAHSAGERLEVRPLPPSGDLRRVPYDEEAIWRPAEFAPGAVRLRGPGGPTFIATVVALNKAMLQRDVPAPGAGQWVFTGFDADEHPGEWDRVALSCERVVARRMAKTAITADGRHIGHLYFGWRDPREA